MFNTAVLPFLADAGASATSDGTTGIIIGSGVAGSLVTLAATWIKARYTRKVELSKPVEVALKEQFVTRTEFDKLAVENRADHDNVFRSRTWEKLERIWDTAEQRSHRVRSLQVAFLLSETALHQ